MDEHHRRGYREGLRRNRPRRNGYGWLPRHGRHRAHRRPKGPEEGEQVETTAPQQQTADAARVSVIDVWDWEESDHPRGQPKNAGQFAKKGAGTSNRKAKKKDLNNSTANAKMYAKNNPPPAPPVKKLTTEKN